MIKKNIVIEILPRALWVFMAVCLFLGQHLTNSSATLTDNILLALTGSVLSIVGFSFWIYVGYYMRVRGALAIKDKELVTDGPFKYIRHPMYVGINIMLIGIGLLFFSFVWFAIIIAFIPIWYLDCKIEEKLMIELYEEKYLDYKKKTGIFLPRIRKKCI